MRQSLRRGPSCEAMFTITQQAIRRGDPKRAVRVLGQRIDRVVRQRGSVVFVEDREARAIEPRQPKPGADPQVAIPRLLQRGDAVLRQAVIGGPASDAIRLFLRCVCFACRRSPRRHATGEGQPKHGCTHGHAVEHALHLVSQTAAREHIQSRPGRRSAFGQSVRRASEEARRAST